MLAVRLKPADTEKYPSCFELVDGVGDGGALGTSGCCNLVGPSREVVGT